MNKEVIEKVINSLKNEAKYFSGMAKNKPRSIYHELVNGGRHFDWWLPNSYPNSNDPTKHGYYTSEEVRYLIKNESYMNAWKSITNQYFFEIGINLETEEINLEKLNSFISKPYEIRLSKIISSLKTIHSFSDESIDKNLRSEIEKKYTIVHSVFKNIEGIEAIKRRSFDENNPPYPAKLNLTDETTINQNSVIDRYYVNSHKIFDNIHKGVTNNNDNEQPRAKIKPTRTTGTMKTGDKKNGCCVVM